MEQKLQKWEINLEDFFFGTKKRAQEAAKGHRQIFNANGKVAVHDMRDEVYCATFPRPFFPPRSITTNLHI
jgi:hypothetical protein